MMPVKLTPRQREFLDRFVDIYREMRKPVHYTLVARKLGVGNVTAYEMLCLLEKRGLVMREYVLNKGPGRSTVNFYPSRGALAMLQKTVTDTRIGQEWYVMRAQTLEALQGAREEDLESLLNQLLRRLPRRSSPLLLMADLVTAVMLAFYLLHRKAQRQDFVKPLRGLGLPGEVGLRALAGLMVGIAMAERANRALVEAFLQHAARFNAYLSELNQEARQALTEFTGEVMEALGV